MENIRVVIEKKKNYLIIQMLYFLSIKRKIPFSEALNLQSIAEECYTLYFFLVSSFSAGNLRFSLLY